MRVIGWVALAIFGTLSRAGAEMPNAFHDLADPETAPYRIVGRGFVTDSSHPLHPGDSRRYDLEARFWVNPEAGETLIELVTSDGEASDVDSFFVRRGRIFQIDEAGKEKDAESLGDLSPATVAALHPAVVMNAMRERQENVTWCEPEGDSPTLTQPPGHMAFAWGDQLWNLESDLEADSVSTISRRFHHDLFGLTAERLAYHGLVAPAEPSGPYAPAFGWNAGSVSVVQRTWTSETKALPLREIAHLDFGSVERGRSAPSFPAGDRGKDHHRLIAASEVAFHEIAPHLFTIDLASQNTRVTVAEFRDFLIVLEGAYNARIGDVLAAAVGKRFAKPVRYFAFSHLHGQYVGSTRSWVYAGARVIVPPTTAPLIEDIVAADHRLQPDAFFLGPQPLHVETVQDRRRIQDRTNSLEIYNVPSDHTDEYFIFYFPRQKVLLTGDLLFYRPGQPLKGRSLKLCETVRGLGLKVDTYVATWPLDGYGTKNVVTAAEVQTAWAAALKP